MAPCKLSTQKVAVIGGGAAGLAAAKELRHEGHTVVVFERESELGGTWVYSSEIESDPIGSDPNRKVVHSSLYQSLRTNLSREIMGFRDFPFIATGMIVNFFGYQFLCMWHLIRFLLTVSLAWTHVNGNNINLVNIFLNFILKRKDFMLFVKINNDMEMVYLI